VSLYEDAQEEALRRLQAMAAAGGAPAAAPPVAPPRALPRATRKASAGGTLSTRVQPGEENIRRGLELMSAEDDYTAASDFARQRSLQGEDAMLNAIAASVAGRRFEPLQGAFLKRAMAAQDPMKVGTATIGPDGTVLRDPSAGREREAGRLLQLGQFEMGLDERRQARADAAAARADNRALRLSLSRMQGGGEVGAGPAPQIGSTPEGAPIFRSNRQGVLFTYDQNGQPTPYSGPLLPKISAAQPTEDERKAAGWFAQADNARRNMANTLARDSTASAPTFKESALSKVPVWGEEFANSARPENRQMFVQAASSMAEALLRAATGAGINESEARQKANELVPILGDKPGVIQQKLESYDVYMASLRARANRALPDLETALQDIYSNRGQAAADAVIDVPYP
jgi:hypothetical protein